MKKILAVILEESLLVAYLAWMFHRNLFRVRGEVFIALGVSIGIGIILARIIEFKIAGNYFSSKKDRGFLTKLKIVLKALALNSLIFSLILFFMDRLGSVDNTILLILITGFCVAFTHMGISFVIDSVLALNMQSLKDMFVDEIVYEEEDDMKKHAIGLRVKYAEESLFNMCEKAAEKIYGSPLPKAVADRMNAELDAILENDAASDYLLAAAIADYSKGKRHPVNTRGLIASTFVSFLCGFTAVNPLPPHRWCEKCHHFELSKCDYRTMGYDFVDKNCPKCGSLMKADGVNILSEVAMGLDLDSDIDISLNLTEEIRPSIVDCIKNTFTDSNVYRAGTNREDEDGNIHKGVHPGGVFIVPNEVDISKYTSLRESWFDDFDAPITEKDYHEMWGDFKKYDLLANNNLDLLHKLEDSTGVSSDEIRMNDKNVLNVFLKEGFSFLPDNSLGEDGEYIYMEVIEAVDPNCFSELSGISAIIHGLGTWKDNGEELIAEGWNINEIITCRDDIMQYLIEKGFEKEFAYQVMNRVRLGKGLTELMEDELYYSDIYDWYVESCNKIKYAFPKSHTVEYMIMYWKLAYYYHYYPKEYASAVNEVYGEKWQ